MINKRYRSVKCVNLVVIALILICVIALAAFASLTTTRFSNTGALSGGADGLEPSGDRHNSYAWSMEAMKNSVGEEYLYVGSNRDVIYVLMKETEPDVGKVKTFCEKMELSTPDSDSPEELKAKIFRKKTNGTGDWETVYTSPLKAGVAQDQGYRGGKSYTAPGETKPSVYFGTLGTKTTRLIKLVPDFKPGDEPDTVFETDPGEFSCIRAVTVHDSGDGDKLYIGTLTPSSDDKVANIQIWESEKPKSNDGNDDWTKIASVQKGESKKIFPSDFPGVRINETSTAFGGVWDMISYNGYLYAFVGNNYDKDETDKLKNGFMVFKGKPVPDGTDGENEAGWKWEPVVCTEKMGSGAKYPNGMGNGRHVTASPFIYKGYVYVGTFADVATSDTPLDSLYPCHVYRFDKDDKWELIIGNTEGTTDKITERLGNYGAGFFNAPVISSDVLPEGYQAKRLSTNQYAWRMGVYKDKLYVTTFDLEMGILQEDEKDADKKKEIGKFISALKDYNPNPRGFDIYYTSDGVNFSELTNDGFGDKYNFGGRTLKATDNGLFIGTANPFNGAQVWKITEDNGGNSGGGCNTGLAVLALLGIIPLALFRKK